MARISASCAGSSLQLSFVIVTNAPGPCSSSTGSANASGNAVTGQRRSNSPDEHVFRSASGNDEPADANIVTGLNSHTSREVDGLRCWRWRWGWRWCRRWCRRRRRCWGWGWRWRWRWRWRRCWGRSWCRGWRWRRQDDWGIHVGLNFRLAQRPVVDANFVNRSDKVFSPNGVAAEPERSSGSEDLA